MSAAARPSEGGHAVPPGGTRAAEGAPGLAAAQPSEGGHAGRPLSHARWGEPLRIDHPEGLMVRCLAGVAWVTLDGVLEDLVLEAGMTRRLHGRGPALVTGMPSCTVQVEPVAAPLHRRDEQRA